MAKKRAKVFGIPEQDRLDAKQQLAEWRAQKYAVNPTAGLSPDNSMRVVMILFRPVGFDAGTCVRLWRNPLRPFVYDVHLLGFPAITGRQKFVLKWTHETTGEILESGEIPIYATAEMFKAALPDTLRKLATVEGGTMTVRDAAGSESIAQTGRWFVSFAQLPEFVPSFDTIPDPRLVGRVLRTDLSVSAESMKYRTVASIDGPTPIHPGSMALAWATEDGLRIGPIEPRIYQEYSGGPAFASYFWKVGPFETFVFEGDAATLSIDITAQNQDIRDGEVEVSVDVAIEYAANISAEDLVGTLDDWMAVAIEGREEWQWADGRLTVTLQPDQHESGLQLEVPSLLEELIEGNQILTVRLSNPLATVGVALIEQTVANVTIVDKNRAAFSIFGPGAVSAPGDMEFLLSITGIFTPGTSVSVFVESSGTATAADVSAWKDSLAVYVGTLDGVTFDSGSGLISWTLETESAIPTLPITVGALATAAGKTFGLSISGAIVSGGAGDIDAGAATVTILGGA